ncbi:hypothetical protein GCM10009737_05210 [Nocardioides lentus]|uniref:YCII-related domain-containing protein n=1 Tax=Nocardioides lentus TaxID=338077 RepID=A0ABP5ACE0_9ACTN
MKYLLLFWTDALPEGSRHPEGFGTEADHRAWADFQAQLEAAGSYVDGGDLEPPPSDRFVRPDLATGDGPEVAASGPSVLTGYYVVEVPDEAAARTVAASVPLHGTVELRPIVDHDGEW